MTFATTLLTLGASTFQDTHLNEMAGSIGLGAAWRLCFEQDGQMPSVRLMGRSLSF